MKAVCRWSAAVLLAAFVVGGTSPAGAQYFGRNKVQYKDFKFEVLKTAHFDVYFYPEEREAVRQAAEMAERWYARLSRVLDHQLSSRQPLILYASHPDFEQTNAISGQLGESTGGVTEGLKRRIVLPLAGPLAESDHVIGHELVHAFQYDIAGRTGPAGGMPGLERLPLWFIEGMAEYLSMGAVDPNTAMWMRDAAGKDKLPRIKDLNDPNYFPYRWGQAFWAYVTGRWGDSTVGSLLRAATVMGDAEAAITRATGLSSDELSAQWHQALRESAAAVRQRTRPVSEFASVLQKAESEFANLNVSPSISPDGKYVMFLSQRSLLSIDLYLADARTGKILRKVVDTSVDPHFSSLQFLNSAGAWSADSRRFAFAVVRSGHPGLVVIDVERDRTEKDVVFEELGEIFNPTWSPDGRQIAFSALQGGLTDLFIYDLQAGTTRRLTNDAYSDLHPDWSPDGRSLAFVTDRFSTRLSTLDVGNQQLARFDIGSGAIRPIVGGSAGKNINPQWVDDNTLVFVSDRNGISNIYRTDVDGLGASPVTNIHTGVTGITSLSPAISYAPGARRLVFSVFENDRYNIYAADNPASADALTKAAASVSELQAAKLPPLKRVSDQVMALNENPTIGLPNARNPQVEPYKAGLQLDFVGQPTIGVGMNAYGGFAGGGLAFGWSDMLGNHNLAASLQINSGFGGFGGTLRNSGGMVQYANLSRRWNWAVTGGQMPYLAGGFSSGLVATEGGVIGVEQTTLFRQVERSATGMAAYPFNSSQRFEVSAGFTNISFDQEVETVAFDPVTGSVLGRETQSLPSAPGLNLGVASAAFVSDTSSFGATSPINGERYRFQWSPTVGTLRYNGVLADYRRYFMPASFYTLAARVLHFGRYGRDGQDSRLIPLYLGYPEIVRGYDFNSFGPEECSATATSACPEFDRLLGSRMLVANLEFRFPLLRPFTGVSPNMYGPVPVEVGVFADAGVAWNRGERPKWFGGSREGVTSAGFLVRVNVLGFAIAQIDYAKPFERSRRGWVWQFSLSPGF
jgi:Tol biopolymer transport system component